MDGQSTHGPVTEQRGRCAMKTKFEYIHFVKVKESPDYEPSDCTILDGEGEP